MVVNVCIGNLVLFVRQIESGKKRNVDEEGYETLPVCAKVFKFCSLFTELL